MMRPRGERLGRPCRSSPGAVGGLLVSIFLLVGHLGGSTASGVDIRRLWGKDKDFIPVCDCRCCSVQICDGIDARGCLPGQEPKCATERKDKAFMCHSWTDTNFIPVDCNPEQVWKRHRKPGTKKKMGHNEFCKDFCNAGSVPIAGKQCTENPPPTVPPPTCCPCKGVKNAPPPASTTAPPTLFPPDAIGAPPGTVIVKSSSFLAAAMQVREEEEVGCDEACCGF